jgi:hypothetical protein
MICVQKKWFTCTRFPCIMCTYSEINVYTKGRVSMTVERKTIQVKPEVHARLERMYNNEIGASLGVRSTSDLIEYLCDFHDEHNSAESILAMEVVKLIRQRMITAASKLPKEEV